MKVKKRMAKDARKTAGFHWIACELGFFGDPTLDLRADDPFRPKVVAPGTIKRGKADIQVKTGKPGLTVCLWKGDEVFEVKKTDKKGVAEFSIPTKTAGDLLLTVSGPSVNVVTDTIKVK